MKFRTGVALTMGTVRNTVLGSYPSSHDCLKPKYGAKSKMADGIVVMSSFVVDAQPLIYSK